MEGSHNYTFALVLSQQKQLAHILGSRYSRQDSKLPEQVAANMSKGASLTSVALAEGAQRWQRCVFSAGSVQDKHLCRCWAYFSTPSKSYW